MNELVDLKKMWGWFVAKWKTTLGAVVFLFLAFWFGMEFKERAITGDCKFMGAFREGADTYNCNMRIR